MPFRSPLEHPSDVDNVDKFIDTLWDHANKQETVFLEAGLLKRLGVKLKFETGTGIFKPFYFKCLPSKFVVEYRIAERQMTPGDRMEIEDYEPRKDAKNPRTYKKWAPLTRGNILIERLSSWSLLPYTPRTEVKGPDDRPDEPPQDLVCVPHISFFNEMD